MFIVAPCSRFGEELLCMDVGHADFVAEVCSLWGTTGLGGVRFVAIFSIIQCWLCPWLLSFFVRVVRGTFFGCWFICCPNLVTLHGAWLLGMWEVHIWIWA